MDTSLWWVPVVVAAIAAVPALGALVGKRAERRDRRSERIVEGYDKLVDDLQTDNAALRERVRTLEAELARSRRPAGRGGGR